MAEAFKEVKAKFLVISISSDWLYPSYQCKEIVGALIANDIDVRHCEIKSNYGHDAFLLESGQMNYTIGNFLARTSVGDIMIQDVVTIGLGSSVEDAASDYDDRRSDPPAGHIRGRQSGRNCHRLGCVQSCGPEVHSIWRRS